MKRKAEIVTLRDGLARWDHQISAGYNGRARQIYQQSLDILLDMKKRGTLSSTDHATMADVQRGTFDERKTRLAPNMHGKGYER